MFDKQKIKYRMHLFMVPILLIALFINCNSKKEAHETTFKNEATVKAFDLALKNGILDVWYPLFIDTIDGGYFSNASYDWKLTHHQPKMIVTQARHLWTTSQAALFYNDTTYNEYARHGFEFLTKKMWDETYGGFFNIRAKDGSHTDEIWSDKKTAYGNAFAIYGLTSYFNLTKDTTALDFAKRTFLWLEKHSHDPVYGGYADLLEHDGTWLSRVKPVTKTVDQNSSWKDFNSSIHLLEAFTELYKVWPDLLVRTRLEEMLVLVRDTFTNSKGYLNLNFTEDWKLVSNSGLPEQEIYKRKGIDHISFGHDVETAFLMLEASFTLEIENDTTTLQIAKKMIDHSLANGFDEKSGGFYAEGYYLSNSDSITIFEKNAEWWTQAEGLNALLMMSKIVPSETKYNESFLKNWSYINNYIIDKEHGEWYINGLNYNPKVTNAPKASIWKCNYHNGRALMNCIRMLKNESEVVEHFSKTGQLLKYEAKTTN